MKSLAALLRTSGQPMPYEKTRPLELVEIDLDKPGEGEVLVKTTAAGICHSDLSVRGLVLPHLSAGMKERESSKRLARA